MANMGEEADAGMVLTKVSLPADLGKQPSIADVARYLGLASEDINPNFGVVAIDFANHWYVIMVPREKLSEDCAGQIYSNPWIKAFD